MFHVKHTGGNEMEKAPEQQACWHHFQASLCYHNAMLRRRMLLLAKGPSYMGIPVSQYQKSLDHYRERAEGHVRAAHALYMGGEQ